MVREELSTRVLERRVPGRRLRLPEALDLRPWLPPVERREFWAVQALVLLIAVVHGWLEYQRVLDEHSPIYLFPTTLYLVPIVYAALNFGLRGAVLTAAWSTVLVVPNVLLWHEGLERAGEIAQVAWITVVGIFVGGRVDRERSARLEAEFREERQRASEERYRAIVNNVGEPIILLDADRRVIEANAAAATLLGSPVSDLRASRLPGRTGEQIIAALESEEEGAAVPSRLRLGQPPRWYQPIRTETTDATGAPTTQLLLIDVTASHEREQGLQGITRQTLATREEEQRRIARELHDGPLQSLVMLWRELDAVASEAPETQREQLRQARATTEAVADELRRFSRDLRPSVLDDLGIAAAIRGEAERLRQRSGIDVETEEVGTPRRLGSEVEVALLRIAQEALRNVERHSRASKVTIGLEFGGADVRLRISDDGLGLDPMPTPSALLAGSHLGLIGMQERARMIGATLDIGAGPAGGLEVVVEAPSATASGT